MEISHEASALSAKCLPWPLLNQDRNKVLVGLEFDALATTQMDFKDVLLVGGLRVRNANGELGRQAALNTPFR
jgi:hypothetical protein